MPLKILFACGGTAGHINPALAVAATIREARRDAEILFAGNPDGMEAKLVAKAGYDFAPIRIHGFQRRMNWTNLKRNVTAARLLMTASGRAKKIIAGFRPDVVMGTGGYVSGPIVRQAAKMGIKTLTHEQNAFPGVTTRLLCKNVDKVLLAVDKARDFLPPREDYVVTGNPIRQEILFADREAARRELKVGDRICLLSFGGSLGAEKVNQAVAQVMARFQGEGRLHFIHATGQYGVEDFPIALREAGGSTEDPHTDIREYIHDMPACMAAADLVLCRAGAISLSELQAAGKASILIPSPNVAENHQYHNAMVLANQGAAVVIEEKDLTGELLCQTVEWLAGTPGELEGLGRSAASMAIVDANQRIWKEIETLLE